MRNASEASQALLRARNFPEILEVQTHLLRNNVQTFLEQSARVAEAASRMAMRLVRGVQANNAGAETLASECPRNTALIKLLDPS